MIGVCIICGDIDCENLINGCNHLASETVVFEDPNTKEIGNSNVTEFKSINHRYNTNSKRPVFKDYSKECVSKKTNNTFENKNWKGLVLFPTQRSYVLTNQKLYFDKFQGLIKHITKLKNEP